jgi:hypothetical protein
MSNPYSDLPDNRFWSRAVTMAPPGGVDPMIQKYCIKPGERIATMGSCFAQQISRLVGAMGMNYFVAESAPPGMDEVEARARGYGVFSARYGNVYTMRQAVQLFDRAFGTFQPEDSIWPFRGAFVDAFRTMIEPDGFATEEAVTRSRAQHLRAVRRVFEESDWLVFTLGLTEAWASKRDGAIYPSAPGVHGGTFDESHYEFVNFTVLEVIEDLRAFVRRLQAKNPRLRIILTVSPVPMIATWEDRHVLVSNAYTKSALRAATDAIVREFDRVSYFPGYEIVLQPGHTPSYFEDNLRAVNRLGLQHVMRVFTRHFLEATGDAEDRPAAVEPASSNESVVCDEEEIERALAESGLPTKSAYGAISITP